MRTRRKVAHGIITLLIAGAASARADTSGQGEIAFQGYYLGGDFHQLSDITGIAANFRTFLPGLGVLSGNLETYGGEGKFRTGDNFIDLNGATWFGLRFRLTGGDFRVPTALLPLPFTNIFLPELGAEGFKVEASRAGRRYAFFYGTETLIAGPRVPFRVRVPQKVFAASVVQSFGDKLEIGARVLNLSTSASSADTVLFAPGQDFPHATTFTANVTYKASSHLSLYGEATASLTSSSPTFSSTRQSPFSFTFGPVWRSHRLTVKANYIHQSPSYLPIAGYFLGDRSGPYIEAQFKAAEGIELFGSASYYRNNIENSESLPTFHSGSISGGASASLPFRFSASAQVSTIDFSVKEPGVDTSLTSYNRQFVATLGRPIRNHNVHFSFRDLDITSAGRNERQRSVEIEDIVQIKKISLGGAVRDQRLISDQSKDTLFIRGSAQTQRGRVSAYAYIEHGDDLANHTAFITNTFNTSVFGGALRVTKVWNVQVEASRNRLTTELNAENIFLLQNQGAFVSNAVTGLNQWTAYFRVNRSIRWGHGLPSGDLDKYTAEQMPIVGSIEGTVTAQGFVSNLPAKNIPVVLDDGRVVATNETGVFRFSHVPEGRHRVSIAVNELPADYDPGTALDAVLDVKPRRVSNAGLSVIPLVSVAGRLVGPPATALDGIVVRLNPADRYTTPDAEGRFAFYNLREGEYDMTIDTASLPEFATLDRSAVHVTLKRGTQTEEPVFRLEIHKPEKPIRRTFEKPI